MGGALALLLGALAAAPLAGCADDGPQDPRASVTPTTSGLAGLPEAGVLRTTAAGAPSFIQGSLGKIAPAALATHAATDQALRPALAPALAAFGLRGADLRLERVHTDARGGRHVRYQQQIDGLDVIGGDLMVHVDSTGLITGMNGKGRPNSAKLAITPTLSPARAVERMLADARFRDLTAATPRLVYITTAAGTTYKAYETVMSGERAAGPVEDKVYVDVATGAIVADYPQIMTAENRSVYDAQHSTSNLPGVLKRREGGPATSDADVNGAYDLTGATYEAYASFWGRDSYDSVGGPLVSSVHLGTNVCNAFWTSSRQQMLFGDGDSNGCGHLAQSADVIGHELTHAVTEHESGLVYAHESGGINESLSDIFGNFVEAWVRGGKDGDLAVTDATFLVGEDVLPPALRFMCNPAADGSSRDLWTSDLPDVEVHSSSGVGNLAFCLMAKGGVHPQGKTTTNVPALGVDRAIRIFYEAQIDYLNSTSDYHDLRTAMQTAAAQLGYDQAQVDAVGCAFAAVGVGSEPANCTGYLPTPSGGVTGDFDGDGKDDVIALYNYGRQEAGLWIFPGTTLTGDGASKSYRVWRASGFDTFRTKVAAGDYNGDGKADLFALVDNGNNSASLFLFPGTSATGDSATAPKQMWFGPAPNSFDVRRAQIVAGDYDGDGKDDLIAFYRYPTGAGVWVFPGKADANGTFLTTEPYRIWVDFRANSFDASRAKITAGDFDGDGKVDLMALYAYPGTSAGLWIWPGTASHVENSITPYLAWRGVQGGTDVSKTRIAGGDFNGDGKADLLALYDYGNNSAGLLVFPGAAVGTPSVPYRAWFTPGPNAFNVNFALPTGGDFDGDGTSDVIALYAYPQQSAGLFLWKGTTAHGDAAAPPKRVSFIPGPNGFDVLGRSQVP